jgi:hypothetical protein
LGIIFAALKEKPDDDMDVIVKHNGFDALFRITSVDDKLFRASLLDYKGLKDQCPPSLIIFIKERDKCLGSSDVISLVQGISKEIKISALASGIPKDQGRESEK